MIEHFKQVFCGRSLCLPLTFRSGISVSLWSGIPQQVYSKLQDVFQMTQSTQQNRLHCEAPCSSLDAPSDSVRVITVHDLDGLQPHWEAWDRLAWESPQALATMLPAWAEAVFRHGLSPNWRWTCCFAYLGERLVGVLPFIVAPHPVLGQHWPILRTNGKLTPSGDLPLAPDCAATALQALLAEVRRLVPNYCELTLPAVRQNSPVLIALQNGMEGHLVLHGARNRFSRLDVTGRYDEYLANLGNIRKNLKRYGRKLQDRGNVAVELRTGRDAKAGFTSEFMALEASGWKGRYGRALLAHANSFAFYSALIENFAAQDRLEWHLIWVDAILVAARLILRCNGSLTLLRYAFNEDFAECRVGTLLNDATFKDAFARRDVQELNPMSKAQAHAFWHMSDDEYVDLHVVRRSVVPMLVQWPWILLRAAYWTQVRPWVPEAVKQVYRSFRRRGGLKPRRAAEIRP